MRREIDAGEARFWTRGGTLDWENVEEYTSGHWASLDHHSADRWLDAGAHIGTFAVYAAKRAEFVVSVEPDQGNHAMLLDNLALNDIENITTYRAALVGNEDEKRSFYLNKRRNRGTHTFFHRGHFVETMVPCINVNDVLRRHRLNCIEMDVEGAEIELLLAIEDWDSIRQIYLEYHNHILGMDGLQFVLGFLDQRFDEVFIDKRIQHKWWKIIIARKEMPWIEEPNESS